MLVITSKDFKEFGCVKCGSKKSKRVSYVPEVLKFLKCDECGEEMTVMENETVNKVWMYTNGSYQELQAQPHPLKRIND